MLPNTEYFFYTDEALPDFSGSPLNSYGDTGQMFIWFPAHAPAGFFNSNPGDDADFLLAGTPVVDIPEPLTLSLFGCGLAGIAAMRRRKANKD